MGPLKRLRWSYGLSTRDVAAGAGINKTHYVRLEDGVTKKPKQDTIQKLATFFGEDPATIGRMFPKGKR
jgi:transcriptional regulator with XRE-family HTH domain